MYAISPITNIRFSPNASAAPPSPRCMAVLLPTYRMMIHWIVMASVPKLSVMLGSATFTVMSSDVRNIPDAAATRPIHCALEEIGLSIATNAPYW